MIGAALTIAFALHTATPAASSSSSTSNAPRPWAGFDDLAGFDKVEHVGANIAIVDVTWGVAAFFGAPLWARIVAGVGVGATISIGKELWDASGHGDPSFGDLSYDALGIGAGVGFALAAEAVWIRVRSSE